MEEIITEARSWLGTKYVKNSVTKGAGCDCVGLVHGVLQTLSLRRAGSSQHVIASDQRERLNFLPIQEIITLTSFTHNDEDRGEPSLRGGPQSDVAISKKTQKTKKNVTKGLPSLLSTCYNNEKVRKALLEELLKNVERVEQIENGCIGVFVFDHEQLHIGLITKEKNRLTLIHAHEAAGKVVEHRLYGEMLGKLKFIYKYKRGTKWLQ